MSNSNTASRTKKEKKGRQNGRHGPKALHRKITRAERVGQSITEQREWGEGPRERTSKETKQRDGLKLSSSMKSLSPLASLDEPLSCTKGDKILQPSAKAWRQAYTIPVSVPLVQSQPFSSASVFSAAWECLAINVYTIFSSAMTAWTSTAPVI